MDSQLIIRHPKSMTTTWAQGVIDRHVPGATARRVEITSVDVGTTTRIRVQVRHDGPDSLPSHWFVKLPSQNWRARSITALPQLLAREIRFYHTLAPKLPVALPKLLAAQNCRLRGSTLVLADLSHAGAVPGGAIDALSVPQAKKVLGQLARLHSAFLGKTRFDPRHDWLGSPVRRTENRLAAVMAESLMHRGLRRAGQAVPEALRRPALVYARHRQAVTDLLADGPHTLVHHDCHPGNLFWRGTEPGLLDWQLVRSGEGMGDVAYFLATSLAADVRRKHELELLRHYFTSLPQQQALGLDFEQLLARYRLHLVYPFEAMLVTLAIGGMMDSQTNLELIKRASAAVLDWDSFAAVTENIRLGKKGLRLLGRRFTVKI